jgi:hypothetical protein
MKIHKIELQSGQTIWIKDISGARGDFAVLLQDPDFEVLTEELADGTIVNVWGADLREFHIRQRDYKLY